jgi:hypothetical protein
MNGDGITLHKNSRGVGYNIGSDNKVLNNVCYSNGEEGLDITSGVGSWIEGNETFSNTRSTTIAHSASDIYFAKNYSHNEPGILVHPRVEEGSQGDVILAYNIVDSNRSALVIGANRGYDVYNNIFLSSTSSIKPSVIDFRRDAGDINFVNNIMIAKNKDGYFLRIANGTLVTKKANFWGNCWWKPQNKGLKKSFYDKKSGSYSFSKFRQFDRVKDDFFLDPKIKNNFSHDIDAFVSKIKKLNTMPQNRLNSN